MEQSIQSKNQQTNLPPVATSFIGRASTLKTLENILSQKRLLTLLGPPGIGKTRLAKEFGRKYLAMFPGGVWFCDLSEARTEADIHLVVYRALGIESSLDESFSRVGALLAGRPKLLILLDNFEQIIPFAKDTVARWLEKAPLAHFLVTSRESLRLREESILPLSPLSLPTEADYTNSEAVQLLVARTKDAGTPVDLSQQGKEVGALCQQLDGIPLAIELAAARMRVFSPAQLLARFENRFALLSRSSVNTVERHATFERAIDFSWELLAPYEQSALIQCSVFRGGFSLEAAEGVLDLRDYPEAPWIPDLLQSLCEKSLIIRQEATRKEVRFGMYLGLRHYFEKKGEQERERTYALHADYFLSRAEGLGKNLFFDENRETRAWLTQERENLLVIHQRSLETLLPAKEGLRSAIVLSPLLFLQGLWRMGASLLEEAISLKQAEIPLSLVGWAYCRLASFQRRMGVLAESLRHCQKACSIAGQLKDHFLLAHVSSLKGAVLRTMGQHQKAYQTLQKALQLAKMLPDIPLVSLCYTRLGLLAMDQDNLPKAREYSEQAITLARKVGAFRIEKITLGNLGMIVSKQGYLEEAEEYLRQNLVRARSSDNISDEGSALKTLGNISLDRRKLEESKTQLTQALRIYQKIGFQTEEATTLDFLAILHQEQRKHREAIQCSQQALQITIALESQKQESHVMLHQGMIYQDQNQDKKAKGAYQRALILYQAWGAYVQAGLTSAFLGALEAKEGNLTTAKESFAITEEILSIAPSRCSIVLMLCREFLSLYKIQQARAAGELSKAQAHKETVEKLLFSLRGKTTLQETYSRFAFRFLEKEFKTLAQEKPLVVPIESQEYLKEALVFSEKEQKFRLPGTEWVSLRRRHPLFLLLSRLVKQRSFSPGEALSWQELSAAGWPGERLERATRQNRLYTAIAMLRKLGLKTLLLHTKEGYLLDPSVPLLETDTPVDERIEGSQS